MTDITDQDRRLAREWAASVDPEMDRLSDSTRAVARVILATVDAPPRTLAEELQYRADLLDNGDPDGDTPQALRDLADHAAQMEHDLAEASAEVERLTAVNENLRRTNNFQEFREQFLTVQKGAESNAESLDPDDVKPGEAWIVEVDGERRTAVKDGDDNNDPWNTFNADGRYLCEDNEDVTLITRLVPAPRVITNADDLDRAKRCTVIRDAAGVVCERDVMGDDWSTFTSPVSQKAYIVLPATVLWEPEA